MAAFDSSDRRDLPRTLTDEALELQHALAEAEHDTQAAEFLRGMLLLDLEQRRAVYDRICYLGTVNEGATHLGPTRKQ